MAEEKKHWLRETIDWARRGHWIWTLFPASSKAYLVGATVVGITAILAKVAHTPLPLLFIYLLLATVLYTAGWAVTQKFGPKNTQSVFDGEVYRIFSYPRTALDFEMYKNIRKSQGSTSDPKVDCDVLVFFYIVNKSDQARYMRTITGSVEINGATTTMERQDDFKVYHAMAGTVEYGWDVSPDDLSKDASQLKALAPEWPYRMEAQAPAEGWVRLMLQDIDPDKINSNTWRFAVVDSVGKIHPITKISDRKRDGTIALRKTG